jgi:methylglutaconyl-CoA hydratase
MTYDFLQIRRDGPVEYLTLNRPDVRNAFNEHVARDLTRWAQGAAEDRALRVVVLAGAGSVFCAGADLAWMRRVAAYTREENVRDAEAMARMYLALDRLPVPLVGRIHGAALGGGAGLVSVCDIAVADEQTVFGFTEVRRSSRRTSSRRSASRPRASCSSPACGSGRRARERSAWCTRSSPRISWTRRLRPTFASS